MIAQEHDLGKSSVNDSKKSRPIIVSLTSIPSRYKHLPAKIASLLNQTVSADAIELYIPKQYRRFGNPVEKLPRLPSEVKVTLVDWDLGPATKLLYALEKWDKHDVDILICDDDRLQDRRWISRFALARHSNAIDIICERGWNIDQRLGINQKNPLLPRAALNPNRGRTLSYRLRRLISLGLYHPDRDVYQSPGYVDIFEGFLGVLVPTGSLQKIAWEIPEILWTVDAVWLSGMAKYNGVGIWAHGLPRPVRGNGWWDKVDSLTDWVADGIDRKNADRLCVEYLRSNFNVWS